MTMTMREKGRCWKDVEEQRRRPVSLGINLATGSTNRLSPPISRQCTDTYLYCQVAAAAAPQKRERRQFKEAEADRSSRETKCDATGHIWRPGNIRGFHTHRFLAETQMCAQIAIIQPEATGTKRAALQNKPMYQTDNERDQQSITEWTTNYQETTQIIDTALHIFSRRLPTSF